VWSLSPGGSLQEAAGADQIGVAHHQAPQGVRHRRHGDRADRVTIVLVHGLGGTKATFESASGDPAYTSWH